MAKLIRSTFKELRFYASFLTQAKNQRYKVINCRDDRKLQEMTERNQNWMRLRWILWNHTLQLYVAPTLLVVRSWNNSCEVLELLHYMTITEVNMYVCIERLGALVGVVIGTISELFSVCDPCSLRRYTPLCRI